MNDSTTIIMNKCDKVRDLYKEQQKILTYLNEHILIKNNEQLMKKALQLIKND